MFKTTIKTAFIGGLITGVSGCASLQADLKARDAVHVETPGTNSKLAEIDVDLKDLIRMRLDKLEKVVDAQANVVAKAIDLSKRNQTQQQVATSQPVTAGRDAKTIAPIVTVNGSDSILLALAGLAVVMWIAGKGWWKSRKTVRTMVKAIEESQGSEPVKRSIEKAAYQAGVAQDLYNHVSRESKKIETARK